MKAIEVLNTLKESRDFLTKDITYKIGKLYDLEHSRISYNPTTNSYESEPDRNVVALHKFLASTIEPENDLIFCYNDRCEEVIIRFYNLKDYGYFSLWLRLEFWDDFDKFLEMREADIKECNKREHNDFDSIQIDRANSIKETDEYKLYLELKEKYEKINVESEK